MAVSRSLAAVAALLLLGVHGDRLQRPREARHGQEVARDEEWSLAARIARRGALPSALLFAAWLLRDEEEVISVVGAFDQIDTSGDGRIEWREYEPVARWASEAGSENNQGVLRLMQFYAALFEYADVDGDGLWSEGELMFSNEIAHKVEVESITRPSSSSGLSDDFKTYLSRDQDFIMFGSADIDGNGRLQMYEYIPVARSMLLQWGLPSSAQLLEAIEGIFHVADISGDEALDLREFHYAILLAETFAQDRSTAMSAADGGDDGVSDSGEVAATASVVETSGRRGVAK